jgi:hypothetical protein
MIKKGDKVISLNEYRMAFDNSIALIKGKVYTVIDVDQDLIVINSEYTNNHYWYPKNFITIKELRKMKLNKLKNEIYL